MGKAKFADVWLVRAGCTQWDQEGRIVGATDLPTCQAGLEAARCAARTLSQHSISSILCAESESVRTTAELISEATEARVRHLDNLGEIGLGLWEGTLACDIEGRCPTAYRQWKTDPSSVVPPEGEAFEDAMARVSASVEAAIQKYLKTGQGLVIVVGPTVFGLIKCWLERRPATDLWDLIEQSGTLERLAVNCGTMTAVQTERAVIHADAAREGGRVQSHAHANGKPGGSAGPLERVNGDRGDRVGGDRHGGSPFQAARR